jgi:hypothetical protein
LIERYLREGLLITIDGEGEIGSIAQRASSAIRGLRGHPSEWEVKQNALDAALT